MVKMNMRKIEDTPNRMEGEDSLIEMRYRIMICNDRGLKPAIYFIVRVGAQIQGFQNRTPNK